MKNLRIQLIIILLTGLVVGLLLISEQTGFRLISPAPAKGGTYTEALIGNMQRLNPVLDYYNVPDRDVDRLIFSRLVTFDERGYPVGDLAEAWGISFDGLLYNFTLRGNAVWHDGQPVTTQDVVYTVEMMRDVNSVLPEDLKSFWRGIEVIALSDQALQFKLPEPFAPFMDYLSFGILPKHLLGSLGYQEMVSSAFNLQPIGSGPYKFERLIIEAGEVKGVVLNSNTQYYGEVPFISQIAFRYYPDLNSSFTAYQEGKVQALTDLSGEVLHSALREPALSVYSVKKPEVSIILLNLNNSEVKFFQDADVRRALLQSINRQKLIEIALEGQGIIADVPLLPGTWAYYDGVARVNYDTQAANILFRKAGYVLDQEGSGVRKKNGVPLSFTMVHPDDSTHTAVADYLRDEWEKVGVEVILQPVPYDSLVLDHLQPLTYQAVLVDLNFLRSPDPDPYPFWDQSQQSGGQNYSQWENRIVSQYLEEARVSRELDERAKLYRNFQVVFATELPALPLYYPVYTFAVSQNIQGIRLSAFFDYSDRFNTISEWHIGIKTADK